MEPARQFWTPKTTVRFPDRTCTGSDEIVEYFNGLFAALPDVQMEPTHFATEGDTVFAPGPLTATHPGPAWAGISRPAAAARRSSISAVSAIGTPVRWSSRPSKSATIARTASA